MIRIVSRILFILVAFAAFATDAHSQMSPFDGSYAIVIKWNGMPLEKGDRILLLSDTAKVDSCSFARQTIRKPFQSPDSVLIKNPYENAVWESRAKEYAKEATFFTPGHMAVVMSMSVRFCMDRTGLNYINRKRNFSVWLQKQNGQVFKLCDVQDDNIYSLSTMMGRWNEIKPLEIAGTPVI
jgi:hypothetical protein